MLDPFYVSAEQSARAMGMPDSGVWAYLWTLTEVTRTETGTVPLCLKLRNLTIPEAIVLEIPYAELRAAEGHNLKMLGLCIGEPTDTSWAIGVPFNTGGYILIEPWLTQVPIGTKAVALRRRAPDGAIQRWHEQLDADWDPDGVRIANAMRVLDLRIREVGRPRVGKDNRIERLARAGLKWLEGHKYHTVEDVRRPDIQEATRDNVVKLMERPPSIRLAEVHHRMREILESEAR
jgi:hypothetical protein